MTFQLGDLCARRRGSAVGKSGPRHCPTDRCRNRHASLGRAVCRRRRRPVRLAEEITSRITVALDLQLVDADAARPIERPNSRLYFAPTRRMVEAAIA